MALATLAACSEQAPVTAPNNDIVTIDGTLKLTVSDLPAVPGVLYIIAGVTGGQGMVTVMSTRYGSLCSTAIAAHHHEAGNQLTIEVTFSQRAALCAADIRAITYRAEISGLSPGAYDVHVVHTNVDGTTGTTLSQRVTVT